MAQPPKHSASKWFAVASEFDGRGKERQAKLAYEKVKLNGLPKRLHPIFYLQYGSTLRNCGELRKAEAVLKKAIRQFPKYHALKPFLALVQISQRKHREAHKTLLKVLVEDTPDKTIRSFRRALRYYTKKL